MSDIFQNISDIFFASQKPRLKRADKNGFRRG